MHKLLRRQLRGFFGAPEKAPPELHAFLAAVEAAYRAADADRARLEQSLADAIALAIDVTDSRRAEEERERSLGTLRATLESTAEGILAVDTAGRLVAYNRRAAEMWHIPEPLLTSGDNAAILGAIRDQLVDPETVLALIEPTATRPSNNLIEFKDGTILERHAVPQYLGDTITGDVCSYRDVTAARRAEAALRESEARYRLLFESNPQPMWVFDSETLVFLAVNGAAESHYGFSRDEFLRMTLADLLAPEDRPALHAGLAESRRAAIVQRRVRHRRKDGSTIVVDILSHSIQLAGREARLVLVTDVTERQRLEEHLRQRQKMEAVGLLAGGIAHDFNNLLTVISGYAALAAQELPAASRTHSQVQEVISAADRAASLTQQLLAFSRQQRMQPRVLDLNELLREMQGLLRRLIREDIELVFAPDSELGQVLADPTQIEQVVMNLVVNARDAMPNGGRLLLATAGTRLEGGEGGADFSVATGDYVRLTVSDTGIGMDATTRSRAFEPFFTTKEKGRGTGLGLSTVYGVVKQSGGYVWLESQPGQGCSVHVHLPRIDPQLQPAAAPAAAQVTPARGIGETVVVAEDEAALRSLVVEVLTASGYRVLAAASGREALELCRRLEGEIDLLLTDVVMPEMNGPELVRQVAEIHPEARILYMSGYADKAIANPALDLASALLEKPFLPADLVRRVREVLAGGQAGRAGGQAGGQAMRRREPPAGRGGE
jgi:two-component system, cell cycle sensor histidine kinase and response regulator CckA